MLFFCNYCSISLQSSSVSSKWSLSFTVHKFGRQATDLCSNNPYCCCNSYSDICIWVPTVCSLVAVAHSAKPHCHDWCIWHIVGTVQLYKHWPLALFPPTVSKCYTSPRHHQCLWSTTAPYLTNTEVTCVCGRSVLFVAPHVHCPSTRVVGTQSQWQGKHWASVPQHES